MDSAPPKPWERGGGTLFNQESALDSSPSFAGPAVGGASGGSVIPRSSTDLASAPALPPRPSQQRTGSYGTGLGSYGSSYGGGYGGYGGGYGSSFGSSMYGGGYGSGMYGSGMYGSSMYGGGYGGYGGMNRYGMNEPMPNSFAQRAEADARHAFQSIESVVHVFGSISMMLESTFNAVYSSFRAVIGVADHFSRLKLHLTQIFSAIAVIKTLKWLFRKVLVLLRLRNAADLDEKWEGAASAALSKEIGELNGKPSRWPVLIFFAMVFGGPWLIWKLLNAFMKEKSEEDWANGNGDHFVAVAQFDFNADSEEEVSFRKGQHIRIAPKELQPRVRGWLMGSVDGIRKGLLPADYVSIKGKQKGKRQVLNAAGAAPDTLGAVPKNTDTAVVSQDTVWASANQKSTDQTDEFMFANAFNKPTNKSMDS